MLVDTSSFECDAANRLKTKRRRLQFEVRSFISGWSFVDISA